MTTSLTELLLDSFRQSLLSRMRLENGCWVYTGKIINTGYGMIRAGDKMISAHRASYQAFIGEIPEGMFVCHSCDNKRCINPAHLWVGTNQDNMRDMQQKGRHGSRTQPERLKLDEAKVRQIRELARDERNTQGEIAVMFSISRETANKVINRKAWRHVE